MHFRLLGFFAAIIVVTGGGAIIACKVRPTESRHTGESGGISITGDAFSGADIGSTDIGSPRGLFSDWYNRDTRGENSGAPSGAVGLDVAPAPKDNLEFMANEDAASGGHGGGPGRPEDSGLPVPSDPFGLVCMGPGGEAFERMQPLFCVQVPQPSKTDIINKDAAIRLGKALFWDVQVGGDGQTACASCHFAGGADNRTKNTIHPGPNGLFEAPGITGAGQSFSPFKNLTGDDRVGSQGVVGGIFKNSNSDPTIAADDCVPDQVAPFYGHRQVTGRNTPTVIGAVFNQFNFWDGRASPVFNGFDPFGLTGNATVKQSLSINSSLASQAVATANNATEMSCSGRKFNGPNSLASKMLARRPLQFQQVSPSDSSLGEMSAYPQNGLNCYGRACTYGAMIKDAFGPAWEPLANLYFSRLWGQALQAYMSTLVPDQTRFDQYLAGKKSLFSPSMIDGLDVFMGAGNCADCHAGPELTDASVNYAKLAKREDQGNDEGFHNLGVTATAEDLGRANIGPFGLTWAQSNSEFNRGAFKTPGLRNLKLTAPYFHNGGKDTIESVVDFYAHRGGDVPNKEMSDELQETNLESPESRKALVTFLRDGLLDCRVEKYRAPFDHPSLTISNGVNLQATGMTGTGSCRLSAGVPPTTPNCIKNPGICDTNSALHGTSVYKDLFGRIGSSAEITPFLTK